MPVFSFLLYTLIFVLIYILTSPLWRKFQKHAPCPFLAAPIIGHLYILKPPITQTFANLTVRFGPVLSLRFGSRPVLMISLPSAAEECLTKNDLAFCNRPSGFLAGKYLGCGYISLTWAPYGPHWRNLRRISAVEILSSHRLQLLAGIRADEVRMLIRRLISAAADGDRAVEMKPAMFDLTMNVMTRMIFGKRYYGIEGEEEAKRFREIVAGTFRLFNEICIGDMVPYLRWLDWRKEERFKRLKEEREILMRELIEEQRRNMKEISDEGERERKDQRPLIQVLLKLQESEPEYYKDEIMLGIMLDLLIGGSDTSAGTMEWALALLLNHPEVLQKAQLEIDTHIGNERLLEESDLCHLPYLRCIITETLRMYPPAPNLIPHESSEDCVVGGYQVPRGTMLQLNLWAIQNDPKIWDYPSNFRPERFEGVDGHRIGFKMMPFGAGRRSCPGEGLAIKVVGLTIGSLIQCFEWDPVDGKVLDMAMAPGFNMHRAEPL
ncbi:hypothetical protein Cgig2_031946 [Carnegiea gigantea]|uniref:Cytochrome P450 n=1 Tax=Carnegiea gigantea TaxID=171969 RepID=A0A9Q1K6R2_9CARY|nr:hypothetical protein Cgig2_031946 [Carnegiea gigantea]